MKEPLKGEILFQTMTPIGFCVCVTRSYWHVIVTIKHPVMNGHEASVQKALGQPDEIRRSRNASDVYLFYKKDRPGRWICAVARRTNGDGFLITAYPTDAMKEGEKIWPR